MSDPFEGGVYGAAPGIIDVGPGVDTFSFGAYQGLSTSGAAGLTGWVSTYLMTDLATGRGFTASFAGVEILIGSPYADRVATAPFMTAIYGEGGDDQIYASIEFFLPLTVRGGEGDDLVLTNYAADDINGNQGNDTVYAFEGDDTVMGGQGDDSLSTGEGQDSVNGNLGNDTIEGEAGADILRGGQGDDRMNGGDGEDELWGDRGADTLGGGAGADRFHLTWDGGADLITDFDYASGDRLVLPAGVAWRVDVAAGGAVVGLSTGETVTLQGVVPGR